jgi:hypothetical protein
MKNSEFFFCYNKQLFTFLHDIKNIDYITIAIHPKTKRTYSMFYKSETLQNALDEYKQIQK